MPRSKSSARWLREHQRDEFVKLSRDGGYRARSAFKLLEIDQRDRLLRPGDIVVDLGAAPGGWSQVAASRVGPKGRVLAVDALPMEWLQRVECIQGDLRAQATIATLLETLAGSRATLVMSDMSPNMSGVEAIDQPRAMGLAELALELAQRIVVPGGDLLVKVFQGDGYDGFMENLRSAFAKVYIRKPRASRSRSRELYLLARGSLAGRSLFPCGVE